MECAVPAFRERRDALHDTGVHRGLDVGDALRDDVETGDGFSNHCCWSVTVGGSACVGGVECVLRSGAGLQKRVLKRGEQG